MFVWHGAKENGLLGSKWPTVPKTSIVAGLDGDMIGRNNPDSAALLGAQSPHKNSGELVAMAMQSNNEGPRFKLDTLWDKTTYVEGWYFRSDHLLYAMPVILLSFLLHFGMQITTHQWMKVQENYPKLKRMTDWMYRTGWKVTNTIKRPALESGLELKR